MHFLKDPVFSAIPGTIVFMGLLYLTLSLATIFGLQKPEYVDFLTVCFSLLVVLYTIKIYKRFRLYRKKYHEVVDWVVSKNLVITNRKVQCRSCNGHCSQCDDWDKVRETQKIVDRFYDEPI